MNPRSEKAQLTRSHGKLEKPQTNWTRNMTTIRLFPGTRSFIRPVEAVLDTLSIVVRQGKRLTFC